MIINNTESMNATHCARLFGISRQCFSRWPCPKNKDGTYCLKDVILWKLAKTEEDAAESGGSAASKDKDVKRLRKAKADRAEFEMQKLRGQVVDRSEVETVMSQLLTRLRQGIMSIPDRIANAGSVADAVMLCRDIARAELNAVADEWERENG